VGECLGSFLVFRSFTMTIISSQFLILVQFPTPGATFKPITNPEVLVIDTQSDKIVSRIHLSEGACSCHINSNGQILVGGYRFDPTSGKPTAGRLSIYSQETHKLIGQTDIGKMPLTLRASDDGKWGFTANIFDGSVSVIDLGSGEVLRALVVDEVKSKYSGVCQGAHGMVYFPEGTPEEKV
jgi:DNA-binding beta-propeller fold protein YncE